MTRTQRIMRVTAFLALWLAAFASPARATDWLPISPEDLALKDNPKQPGADAMILYRQVSVDVSKANTSDDSMEEYVRIKVFTQQGTKWGQVNIEFVRDNETIPFVAARTIRPDGSIVKFDGKVLETTIERSNGIKVLAKTFTLPDVEPGCIIEYIYQRLGKAGRVYDRGWQVSESIYTREAHFSYTPFTGYGSGLRPMYRTYLLPADAALKEQANGSYSMAVRDIAAVVEEPLMPPERPIEARVSFYYQDSGAPSGTDPSDHYWNYYAKKWNGDLEHFIDKKNALNQELSKITGPGDSPEVKLRKIYARVQQVRNLGMEDFKTAKEHKDENLKENSNVEDVLNRGYAYGREINYLFVGLARAAGFEATEVYVAPRNRELFLPKRNEVGELQADVVWVHAGSQEYYLDPAARYFPFGLLPWYETATGGIRADKHNATMVNIPDPSSSDATIVRNGNLEVKVDGSISGVLQVDFRGQRAALLREEKRKEDSAGVTKDFRDNITTWLPAGAVFEITKIANWDDNEQPIHVEGNLTIPSFASSAAERLLMPLELFEMSQTREFASEKRVNIVYFDYPYEEIDDIKLRVPLTYKVETVPPARNVNLGAVSYEISASAQGNLVEVKRHLIVKGGLFSKEQYPVLRRFFGTVKTDDNATMVLQNAQSAKNN